MARKTIGIKDILPKLSTLLDLMDEKQRELFIKHMTVQTYRKNDIIYAEGEPSSYLHCLVSGKVKIQKEGVGGRAQIVRVIKPIEYFGYRAAFAGQNYASGALAFEPSAVVRVPIGTIMHIVQQNAQLGWFFIEYGISIEGHGYLNYFAKL